MLTPVRLNRADAVRAKPAVLGPIEKEVAGTVAWTVAWSRNKTRKAG